MCRSHKKWLNGLDFVQVSQIMYMAHVVHLSIIGTILLFIIVTQFILIRITTIPHCGHGLLTFPDTRLAGGDYQ